MKKKYISPRILVEKMDISLLVDTSGIPVNQNERKPLDGKACFDGSYDEEEYWYFSGKSEFGFWGLLETKLIFGK